MPTKKKNNSNDVIYYWWKRYKTLISILAVIIPATIGFNYFLSNFILQPHSEREILKAEKELFNSTISLKSYYEGQITNLKITIKQKEDELGSLRIRLERLLKQDGDQQEIAQLKQKIVFQEEQIKFYKEQIARLKKQLNRVNTLIEGLKKTISALQGEEVIPDTSEARKIIAEAKHLRSEPTSLSSDEVVGMLKKHDFYCNHKNSNGKGYDNNFELQKNGLVVYDKTSDLMWQWSGSFEVLGYENAKKYIDELNTNQFADFQDWRLPTLEEAMSLMEPVKNENVLPGSGRFTDTVFNGTQRHIWTNDPVECSSLCWVVDYESGVCFDYYDYVKCYVRAVRSVQSSDGH